jgi:hypothetical protein
MGVNVLQKVRHGWTVCTKKPLICPLSSDVLSDAHEYLDICFISNLSALSVVDNGVAYSAYGVSSAP